MELREFLRAASKRERAEVARACNDSVMHLYQLAGRHSFASPALALRIEELTHEVAQNTRGRLEVVPRETLVRHPDIFYRSWNIPTACVSGAEVYTPVTAAVQEPSAAIAASAPVAQHSNDTPDSAEGAA